MSAGIITRNSELLYLYDAKLCNPNGDPDEENRPRMDYESGRNLVSDVRFKRYLRDYWLEWSPEDWEALNYDPPQDVWVRQVDGKTISAKQRIEGLANAFGAKSAKDAAADPKFRDWLLARLVDARLFGATIPIGGGGGEGLGSSLTLTGPVQFSWGYSLNRVEILPSSTISSRFAGRESGGEEEQYGTFGKDWRVRYSFLAFYGTISAWRARHTGLTEQDVQLLDASLLRALPLLATTRSKLGQTPRLYLRVQYVDDRTLLGDLRRYLRLEREEGLEGIKDIRLNYADLAVRMIRQASAIEKIFFWTDLEFPDGRKLLQELKENLEPIPIEWVELADGESEWAELLHE